MSQSTLPMPSRIVFAVLALLLAAATAAYFIVGPADPPEPGTKPVLGDSGSDYRSGALPDGLGEAVAVAVEVMPLALGYDYRDISAGLDDATALMTEDFGREYRRTFRASAAELARTQQAVTTATVRAAGLVGDEGDEVVAVVYVDQALVSSTTLENKSAPVRVSQNRVLVGLAREDGAWRVTSITPY